MRTKLFIQPGSRFGRLVARNVETGQSAETWLCLCDCGKTKSVRKYELLSGDTKSCGCLRREHSKARMLRHGHTHKGKRSPEHTSWSKMLERCFDKKAKSYEAYGAKGITVCERWMRFENFLEDMGPRPKNTTLDRIDNKKGYGPGNCRWATHIEQSQNRDFCHLITFNGETLPLAEWGRRTGINWTTIRMRIIKYGWSVEDALTKPPRPMPRRQLRAKDLHR